MTTETINPANTNPDTDPSRPFVSPGEEGPPELGTVSTTVSTTERKVTWGYTRKKNMGKDAFGQPRFESEEVSLYVTDMVPEGEDIMAWVEMQTDPAFDIIKAEVWNALGLTFTYSEFGKPTLDEEHQRQVQVPQAPPVFTNPRDPQPVGSAYPPPTPPPPSGSPANPHPRRGSDGPVMAQVGYHAQQPEFCGQGATKGGCGHRDFYDNRAEVDATMSRGGKCGPDWVCKACKKGVFRRGSFDYNQALGSIPPPQSAQPQQVSTQPPSMSTGGMDAGGGATAGAPMGMPYPPDEEPF